MLLPTTAHDTLPDCLFDCLLLLSHSLAQSTQPTNRYNPATGDLTIACDRFPTREENRRWCLEVLHRLLQAAQGAAPADSFWLDSSALGVQRGYNPAVVVVGGGGGGGGRKTEGKA